MYTYRHLEDKPFHISDFIRSSYVPSFLYYTWLGEVNQVVQQVISAELYTKPGLLIPNTSYPAPP